MLEKTPHLPLHQFSRPRQAIPCHPMSFQNVGAEETSAKTWLRINTYIPFFLPYFDICFGGMNVHESPFRCSSRKEIHGWPELAHTSKPPNRPQQLILLPQILPCSPGGLCFLLQRQLQRCLHCLFFNCPVLAEVRSMFFKA